MMSSVGTKIQFFESLKKVEEESIGQTSESNFQFKEKDLIIKQLKEEIEELKKINHNQKIQFLEHQNWLTDIVEEQNIKIEKQQEELKNKDLKIKELEMDKIKATEHSNESLYRQMNTLKVEKKAVQDMANIATKKVDILEEHNKKMMVALHKKDQTIRYLMANHVKTVSEQSTTPSSSFRSDEVPNNEKTKEELKNISVPKKKEKIIILVTIFWLLRIIVRLKKTGGGKI